MGWVTNLIEHFTAMQVDQLRREQPTIILRSSHGNLIVHSKSGAVMAFESFKENDPEDYLPGIVRVDIAEHNTHYKETDPSRPEYDIFDFGFWDNKDVYEEPGHDWRSDRDERIAEDAEFMKLAPGWEEQPEWHGNPSLGYRSVMKKFRGIPVYLFGPHHSMSLQYCVSAGANSGRSHTDCFFPKEMNFYDTMLAIDAKDKENKLII